MKKIFLDECHSTQEYLKNQIEKKGLVIGEVVATLLQTKGKGQRGRNWLHVDEAIALSVSYKPCDSVTLTPLEVGVKICDFWKKHFGLSLSLKWPNDIFDSRMRKVGGVLCELLSKDIVIVGVGLNLYHGEELMFDYPCGTLFNDRERLDVKELSFSLADFLLSEEIKESDVVRRWEERCFHLGSVVEISGGRDFFRGRFQGIDGMGRCVIEGNPGPLRKFVNGSLRIIN